MRTILAIGAHPDDVEIGCGGTLARMCAQGDELVILIVTSGEEGGDPLQREQEARASAEIIGASRVIFLRAPDGAPSFSKELKLELISQLRTIRPTVVFTHAKSDFFPDHQLTHQLSLAAITAAAGPWYPAAKGAPHSVSEVYGYEVWNPIQNPQLTVNVSETFERKLQALAAHTSQTGAVGYLAGVRGLAMYRGAMSMMSGFAEVFEVLKVGIEGTRRS